VAERSTRATIGIGVIFAILLVVGAVGVWMIMARQMAENAETASMDAEVRQPMVQTAPASRTFPERGAVPSASAATPDAR
jgi:uncharacterized protein YpmB